MPTKRLVPAVETDTAMPLTVEGGNLTVAIPAGGALASGLHVEVATTDSGAITESATVERRLSGHATHPPRELTGGEYAVIGVLAQVASTVAIVDFDASGLEAAVVALLTFVALMHGTRHLPPFN